ncbi:putative two-component system response regulator [Actinacidiphila reveromycinica]|uniref:Putative two-component system response regulator n=1 Tax=Actinacidiphila reveromycinica TaxID=659352 RepID=A0A7U3UYY0_9ACTN|nr:response regulator transcription factor [Streptomyces sp. SN-593]BBB01409.1 putative two-component system response regulator [Streptomyces sp. SN-593]
MYRLLLVKADAACDDSLEPVLRAMGHRVTPVDRDAEVLDRLRDLRDAVDLIVLDIASPHSGTFETCRRIQAENPVPLVILAAQGNPNDVVTGLNNGAADYLVKPVGARVLEARLRAVLRRSGLRHRSPERALDLGPLSVDIATLTAVRDGVTARLTPIEVRLLIELAARRGRVVPRRTLLERVWGHRHTQGDMRLVDTCVSRLRRKIEPDPSAPALLLTVRGVGYRLSY